MSGQPKDRAVFEISGADLQLLMLALAIMVKERPGMEYAASQVALEMRCWELFEQFKKFNPPDPEAP